MTQLLSVTHAAERLDCSRTQRPPVERRHQLEVIANARETRLVAEAVRSGG